LREALESVRRQTARRAIAQVIVSENSTNGESRKVCGHFKDLPIVYVQQKPPVPAMLHMKVMWDLVQSPLVAILHDDDWWAPEHLELALAALEVNKDCVAVYSNWYETFGPRSPYWISEVAWLTWLAAGCDFGDPVLYLDPTSMMLTCLLNASLHYSTVVGRNEAMLDACLRNVARNNDFDNDRTFPVFLSSHGRVGYLPAPSVFVRQHPFRDAWRPEIIHKHFEIANETTRYLWNNYRTTITAAAARFNETMIRLGPQESGPMWTVLRNRVGNPHLTTLIQECGLELEPLLPIRCRSSRSVKGMIKSLCPPVLWDCARRLRARLGGGCCWQKDILRWQAEEASRIRNC
jgi:hypothetical protein